MNRELHFLFHTFKDVTVTIEMSTAPNLLLVQSLARVERNWLEPELCGQCIQIILLVMTRRVCTKIITDQLSPIDKLSGQIKFR